MSVLTFMGDTSGQSGNAALEVASGFIALGQSGIVTASEAALAAADGIVLKPGPAQSPLSALTAPVVAAGASGNPNGVYIYCVTFVTAAGETTGGPESTVTLTNQQGTITNIPVGSPISGVIARKIYRTAAGGTTGTEKLVGTLSDNTTTSYTDNVADGSLGSVLPTTDTSYNVVQPGFNWQQEGGGPTTPPIAPPNLTGALLAANNLGDVKNPAAARSNLGLGTAATQPSSAFDTAGSAATAQSTAETFATNAVSSALAGLAPAEYPAVAQGSGLTHSGVGQTVGGVVVTAGMRILDTANAVSAGLWVAAAGAWARPTDFQTNSNAQGKLVEVDGGSLWLCISTSAVTVDTTTQVWTELDASIIQAGLGLSKSGTTLNLALTKALVTATGLAAKDVGAAQDLADTAVLTGAQAIAAGQRLRVDISSGNATGTLLPAPPDGTRCAIKVDAVNATPGTFTATLAASGSDVFNAPGGSVALTFAAKFSGATVRYHAADSTWAVENTDAALGAPLGAAKSGSDGTVGGPGGTAFSSTSAVKTGPRTGSSLAAPYLRDFVSANDFKLSTDPDDTNCIQAAANAAINAGLRLYVPGPRTVSSELLFQNPSSSSGYMRLDIDGGGSGGSSSSPTFSAWNWAGGSNTSFIRTVNLVRSTWTGIYLTWPTSVSGITGFDIDVSATTPNCDCDTFIGCHVSAASSNQNGWRIGESAPHNANISVLTWINSTVVTDVSSPSQVGTGWRIMGNNTLVLTWFGGGASGCLYGFTTATDGSANHGESSLFWYALSQSWNTTDFWVSDNGNFTIHGGRFELGQRFIDEQTANVSPGTNGGSTVISVVGAELAAYAPSDGILINRTNGGHMVLDSCYIGGNTTQFGAAMITLSCATPTFGTLNVRNCSAYASAPFYTISAGHWTAYGQSNIQLDSTGHAAAAFADFGPGSFPSVTTITATGTYTVPATGTYMLVAVGGGGGGGGGGASQVTTPVTQAGGAGGGAGGSAQAIQQLTAGTVLSITVGAGGAGGAGGAAGSGATGNAGTNGTHGGVTTITGGTSTVYGNAGGGGNASGASSATGAAGGLMGSTGANGGVGISMAGQGGYTGGANGVGGTPGLAYSGTGGGGGGAATTGGSPLGGGGGGVAALGAGPTAGGTAGASGTTAGVNGSTAAANSSSGGGGGGGGAAGGAGGTGGTGASGYAQIVQI